MAAARPREDKRWPFSPRLRPGERTRGHGGGGLNAGSSKDEVRTEKAEVEREDGTEDAREDARENARSDARAVAGADFGWNSWSDARAVRGSVVRSACRSASRFDCGVVPRDDNRGDFRPLDTTES